VGQRVRRGEGEGGRSVGSAAAVAAAAAAAGVVGEGGVQWQQCYRPGTCGGTQEQARR